MVGLKSSYRLFANIHGSIGPQRCTLRCPKHCLLIACISLVNLSHLLVQSRHGKYRQPKTECLSRPLVHTPRKVGILGVFGTVQKANELRTDIGMRIPIDLVLLEVFVEARQAVRIIADY